MSHVTPSPFLSFWPFCSSVSGNASLMPERQMRSMADEWTMPLVHQDGTFRYTSNDGAWNINFWRLHSTYDWALHGYLITILLEGCFDIPFWCWAFRPNVSRLLLQHGHAAISCLALWHSPKQRGFGRAMKGDTENCRAGKGMTEAFSFWPSHGHHGHLSKKVVGAMGSTYNVKVAHGKANKCRCRISTPTKPPLEMSPAIFWDTPTMEIQTLTGQWKIEGLDVM